MHFYYFTTLYRLMLWTLTNLNINHTNYLVFQVSADYIYNEILIKILACPWDPVFFSLAGITLEILI